MSGGYRRLCGLLAAHRGPVFIVTIEGKRWITDRFVLIDAEAAGLEQTIRGLDDGAYTVFASRRPAPHSAIFGAPEDLAVVVANRLDTIELTEKHPVELTDWSVIKGADTLRMYVRHDPDRKRVGFLQAELVQAWIDTFTPPGMTYWVEFAQGVGHRQPVEVRQVRTHRAVNVETDKYDTYASTVVMGYVMPCRIEDIPPFPVDALEGGA